VKLFRSSLWLGAFLALATLANAQPRITEFVAINAASLVDGDGNTPDWIEIHNPDPTVLDLSGYHLTDDVEIPNRYTFPPGTTIPAGGYLVVFASGRLEANYTDAGGSLHTNFSLSGTGEYLALNAPDNTVLQAFAPVYPSQFEDVSYGIGTAVAQTTLVAVGAPATWLVPAADIGNAWQTAGFNDATWNVATTGIGYGYDNTLIGPGGDTRNAMWFINPSVYLRVPFEVADPSTFTALDLQMRFEDGFAAYLNGTQVASANAPLTLTRTSNATAVHPNTAAVVAESFALAPGALVTGTNILAIQGLNFSTSGTDSSDFLVLPELKASSSSGAGAFGYFTSPTPRAANGPTPLLGFVKDTKFSHKRGYYTAPFNLVITSSTPDATIIYTTNGTPPSATNGTTYSAPIPISSTTTLRALAIKEGFQPTNIDTQTYLFVDSIVRQTRPAGYPTSWGGGNADYDMDPDIVDHAAYSGKFQTAFAALPTLSLVCDPDAFFHPTTGIYQNPLSEGEAWERPLSAEFIVPDQSEPGFQINAGVRIQGGSSRSTDTPKHSLSLRFSAEYGAGKLRYPLYKNTPNGKSAVESFDLLQLRPEYNFGWMHRHWYQALYALYGRDQWASDLFNSMGQHGSHGRWVHLFLNGVYWGVYDVQERPDADFMASYYGGSDADYDTVNSSVATAGDLVAFNAMMDIAYGDIANNANYAALQDYLDVDSFIDYMILNAYVGNRDWDGHNWRAGRKREPGAGYQFVPWDTEFAASHVPGGAFSNPPDFFSTALATNVTGNNGNRRPTGLQTRLALNAEYRLRYADHIRRHFFNGGILTPEKTSEAWTTRSTSMFDAIVAESARWGDFRRDVTPGQWSPAQFALYTRDDHYLPVHGWLVDTYIPQRSAIVLGQLRARSLYPATDAPDFSQHGGTVPRGFSLQITAPATIHYTVDGSDPRLVGGAVNPTATALASGSNIILNLSTQLKARTRAGNGEWSALTEAFFTVSADDLRITEIMYHPPTQPLAEFLELTNSGPFAVSLTGLHFTAGITFDFGLHSSIQTLEPGARLLVVRDLSAFRTVHGNSLDPLIAGTFQNGSALSNDGETITLSDANDAIVLTVTYNDATPWPAAADGAGRSLVFTGGEPSDPLSWRPSAAEEGNPGASDATPYSTGSLLDYVLAAPPEITVGPGLVLFTYTTHLTADDATVAVQHSTDLAVWTTVTTPIVSQLLNPDNSRSITIELPSGTLGFAHLVLTSRP
jgi:hypothetical protein